MSLFVLRQFTHNSNMLHVPILEAFGGRVPQTLEEATASYKKKAKLVHPDRRGGDTKTFQDLQNEYVQCKVHFGTNLKQNESETKDEMLERLKRKLAEKMARLQQITSNKSANEIPDGEFDEVQLNVLKTLRYSCHPIHISLLNFPAKLIRPGVLSKRYTHYTIHTHTYSCSVHPTHTS